MKGKWLGIWVVWQAICLFERVCYLEIYCGVEPCVRVFLVYQFSSVQFSVVLCGWEDKGDVLFDDTGGVERRTGQGVVYFVRILSMI